VGTWRLVAVSHAGDGIRGEDRNDGPLGAHPTGLLAYTADGHMFAVLSHDRRKPLSGDRTNAPIEERAEAFATAFAYAGRYSVAGDHVLHHVEVSTVQNWVGTDMVRAMRFDGDRLTLTTPPLSVGGVMRAAMLVWKRVR
jgi:hypothetical protein